MPRHLRDMGRMGPANDSGFMGPGCSLQKMVGRRCGIRAREEWWMTARPDGPTHEADGGLEQEGYARAKGSIDPLPRRIGASRGRSPSDGPSVATPHLIPAREQVARPVADGFRITARMAAHLVMGARHRSLPPNPPSAKNPVRNGHASFPHGTRALRSYRDVEPEGQGADWGTKAISWGSCLGPPLGWNSRQA